MNEKMKEPRIYLSILVYVFALLPCMSFDVSMDMFGESASSSSNVNGFVMLTHTFTGYIVLLLPIVMLLFEFLLNEKVKPQIIYMICGIAGVVLMIVSTILYSNFSASGGNEYASTDMEIGYKFGFWLEILTFIAIVVYTAFKDFALNKEAIQEKGIKGALTDVASQVASETISATSEIKSINTGDFDLSAMKNKVANAIPKVICPNCGAECIKGKKFCSKCGTKIEVSEETENISKGTEKNDSINSKIEKGKTEMTVSQVLARVKDVPCENCGTKVGAGIKFCPDCGEKIVVKISPKKCTNCGVQLIPGKKFCPDCGEKIIAKELQTNCAKCGADLIFGKKFCVECGEKILDN